MDNDLVETLNKAVILAQEKIITFLKDNSDEKNILITQELFNNCQIHITNIQENNDNINDKQNIGGYATEDGIFISEDDIKKTDLNIEIESDKLVGILIHEYAHKLRKINASYGNMFEEATATIFAEMCINYSKIKANNQIDNNSLFSMLTSIKYQKAESQVRSLMYLLNQKELDNELIIEYILGNQNIFAQKCQEIFGEDFNKYFEIASSNKDSYYDKISDNNSEKLLVDLLTNYIKNNDVNLSDYFNSEKKYLFFRGSPTLCRGVVNAGSEFMKEEEKNLYDSYDYSAKLDDEEKQFIDHEQEEKIKSEIINKYSLEGKNAEEIYNTLCDLFSYYIQHMDVQTPENIVYMEKIKEIVPNIDEICKNFLELRKNVVKGVITSESLFGGRNDINYSNLNNILIVRLQQVDDNQKKNSQEYISKIFDNCTTKDELFNKIMEIDSYKNEIDINEIFPNYDDFVRYCNELKDMIHDNFESHSYNEMYEDVLKSIIITKSDQLDDCKQQAENYRTACNNIDLNWKVLNYEQVFNVIKQRNDYFINQINSRQTYLNQIRQYSTNCFLRKNELIRQYQEINSKGSRVFKKKELQDLQQKINNMDNLIQSYNTNITQVENQVRNLQHQGVQNETQLINICGLNINSYNTILARLKQTNETMDSLVSKKIVVQEKFNSLNINQQKDELKQILIKNNIPVSDDLNEYVETNGLSNDINLGNYQLNQELLHKYIDMKTQELVKTKQAGEEFQRACNRADTEIKVLTNEQFFNQIKNRNESCVQQINARQPNLDKINEYNASCILKRDELARKYTELNSKKIKIFKKRDIKELEKMLGYYNGVVNTNNVTINQIQNEIRNYRILIDQNEAQIFNVSGLNTNDYGSTLAELKQRNVTVEQLELKKAQLREKLKSLNIEYQEYEIRKLYEQSNQFENENSNRIEQNQGKTY